MLDEDDELFQSIDENVANEEEQNEIIEIEAEDENGQENSETSEVGEEEGIGNFSFSLSILICYKIY